MPTYLVHGFRWQRINIRIHIILNDLEDAAPDWILAPATSLTILESFHKLYDFLPPSHDPTSNGQREDTPQMPQMPAEELLPPKSLKVKHKGSMSSLRSLGRRKKDKNKEKTGGPPSAHSNGNGNRHKITSSPESNGNTRPTLSTTISSSTRATTSTTITQSTCNSKPPAFNDWSAIKLLEQYDPDDLHTTFQPYAYVADYMVQIKLSADITAEMSKYEAWRKEQEMLGPTSPPAKDGHSKSGTPSTSPTSHSGDLSNGNTNKKGTQGWFERLRDTLQAEEEVGWYVVVCGDEERATVNTHPELQRQMTMTSSAGSEVDGYEDVPIRPSTRSDKFKGLFKGKKVASEEQE